MEQISDLYIGTEASKADRSTRLYVFRDGVFNIQPSKSGGGKDIVCSHADNDRFDQSVWRDLEPNQLDSILQQVATQTEALMYMAHKLRLQPLIKALHGFLFRYCITEVFCNYNGARAKGILNGRKGMVLTDRVTDVALGGSTVTKPEWINSILMKPYGATTAGYTPDPHALLQQVGKITFCSETKTLDFDARTLLAAPRAMRSVCAWICLESTQNSHRSPSAR